MSVFLLIAMLAGAAGFALLAALTGNGSYWIIAYSFAAVLPVSFGALFDNRRDIFSPLNVMSYLMIMSSPVFAVYIYFLASDERKTIKMYGLEFHELSLGITLILAGTFCMVAGYAFAAMFPDGKAAPKSTYSAGPLRILAFFVIVGAVIAGYFYAKDVGLSAALAEGGSISAKRVHEDTLGVAPRGSALTHWRVLGTSLPHALIIVYLTLIWTGQIPKKYIDLVLIGAMLVLAAFIPFIASTRTPIFEILLILIMLRHYIVRPISFWKMSGFALIGLFAVGLLGQMRQNPDTQREQGLARYFGVFEEVVAASYFMDIGKSAIVIRNVPAAVDYIHGSSLVSVFVAVIPRQIWPEKPIVRIGYFVGQEVIGLHNTTGIPPGLMAELYLNFGYWFVPVPMFLLGMLMRRLYAPVSRHEITPASVIRYVLAIDIIGIALLPTDLTYALVVTLTYGIPAALFLLVSRTREKAGSMLPQTSGI
jgi:oligosaccharide repeat unit polymerase